MYSPVMVGAIEASTTTARLGAVASCVFIPDSPLSDRFEESLGVEEDHQVRGAIGDTRATQALDLVPHRVLPLMVVEPETGHLLGQYLLDAHHKRSAQGWIGLRPVLLDEGVDPGVRVTRDSV